MQAVPSYYTDLLSETPLDTSTADYSYLEYRTSELNISNGNNQSGSNWSIVINDTNQWLLLHRAYLQLQVKLVTNLAAEMQDAASVSLATLAAGGANVFNRIELIANGSVIDSVENPGLVQLMNALLYYSKDKLASVAEAEWLSLDFAKDGVGVFASANDGSLTAQAGSFTGTSAQILTHTSGVADVRQFLASAGANAGAENPYHNAGFASRWLKSRPTDGNVSRTFEYMIPLASILGFCRDIRCVHRGIKWELTLQKNLQWASIIHGKAGAINDLRTVLKKVSLWVPSVTPSLTTLAMLEESMNTKDIVKKVFENMTIRPSETYPSGTTEVEYFLPLEGKKPTRLIFFARRQAQYTNQNDIALTDVANQFKLSSETHSNPSTFSTLCTYNPATRLYTGGIVSASLRVNTKSIPREQYEISFSDEAPEYQRVYSDFLKISGAFNAEIGSAVSYRDFKELYPCFAFDLKDYSDVFTNQRQNDVRFRMRIQGGSPTAFQLYCVVYSERELITQSINGAISLKV